MKKILITEVARFLDPHLCDRFVSEEYHVIGMDNLITGDLKNIEHLFTFLNFEFYNHDISKFVHILGKLDYILHFVSPANLIDYLKIPIKTLKVGSLGTYYLLGLAKEILGWQPTLERSEGMKGTLEYFRDLSKEELYKNEHKDFSSYS